MNRPGMPVSGNILTQITGASGNSPQMTGSGNNPQMSGLLLQQYVMNNTVGNSPLSPQQEYVRPSNVEYYSPSALVPEGNIFNKYATLQFSNPRYTVDSMSPTTILTAPSNYVNLPTPRGVGSRWFMRPSSGDGDRPLLRGI